MELDRLPPEPSPAFPKVSSHPELDSSQSLPPHDSHDQDEPSLSSTVEGIALESLPPVDTGWMAWRFLASATVLDCLIWGAAFSCGTWQEYYISHLPFSTSSTASISAIGTTSLGLLYTECIFGVALCRRYPQFVKLGIWVCLAVYVVALVIASFATQVWLLILCQGVLCGLAAGFMYAPIYVYLNEWFFTRRALAGGIIYAGSGWGGFIFPLMINALLPKIGFRWTIRFFAGLTAVFGSVAVLGVVPRIPVSKASETARWPPLSWRVVIDPLFLVVSFTIFIQGFLYSPLIVFLPSYSANFMSSFNASLILAILNAASVPGQICAGGLCDRFNYAHVMVGSGVASILSVFGLLRVGDTLAKMLGFAILIGFAGGGFSSTWFRAALDITGNTSPLAPSVFGLLSIVRGLSSILGPLIAGKVYDARPAPRDSGSTAFQRLGLYSLGGLVLFVGLFGVVTVLGAGGAGIISKRRKRV